MIHRKECVDVDYVKNMLNVPTGELQGDGRPDVIVRSEPEYDAPPPLLDDEVFIGCSFSKLFLMFDECVFVNCEFASKDNLHFQNCVFVSEGKIDDTLQQLLDKFMPH